MHLTPEIVFSLASCVFSLMGTITAALAFDAFKDLRRRVAKLEDRIMSLSAQSAHL